MKKKVAVLGSTGSIGVNTLSVLEALKDDFSVEALSTFGNTKLLAEQIKRFKPKKIAVVNPERVPDLKKRISLKNVKVFSTPLALELIAELKEVDIVVMAISGASALNPLLTAIRARKKICLANKEALVMAGNIIMSMADRYKVSIIPVDSEHSAIFQCIRQSHEKASLNKIYLTGSGGPLRNIPKTKFQKLSMSYILRHPKWNMGPKITVDSATLMNKGLEIIEAKHLFKVSANKIKVLIHPEAVIHSMVEFTDGTILAQLAATDMRVPIQYALTFPKRAATAVAKLDFDKIRQLNFFQPQIKRFPCLYLANVACKLGGTYPAVLNAADEEAVYAYLAKRIEFIKIPQIIEKILVKHNFIAEPTLEDIIMADGWAREETKGLI